MSGLAIMTAEWLCPAMTLTQQPEQAREQEFRSYVEALPDVWHSDLYAGDTVASAMLTARRAGWTMQHLIDDALATHRRGQGVGMLVTRLRNLARTSPPTRTAPNVRAQVEALFSHNRPDVMKVTVIPAHVFASGASDHYCDCGLPEANRIHVA